MDPSPSDRSRVPVTFGGWQVQGRWAPKVIVRAEGSTFWDDAGHAYLDFASQLVATNLGHGNAAVADAIARQARTLPYVAPSFTTEARIALTRALDTVLPEGVRRYFFSTSGTEANEAALKIARLVTGRSRIAARPRSYHGSTAGSISVTGDFRRTPVEGIDTVPGTVFVPECYCYRCPLNLTYPSCGVACAEEAAAQIDRAGDVAGLILEPVVGTNGVVVPVPEYLPKIREITRQRGVLLLDDEVMTGWGRTGAWFAVDHYGVRPDILTTAKGITGGYAPLGLTATTPEIFEKFRETYFPHGHTYEGHPLTLAPATAAIAEYRRLNLIDKSRADGEYMLRRLKEMEPRHPSVGEVRGLGLFAAVELVRDRRTRAAFNTPEDKLAGRPTVAEAVAGAMMSDGVYVLPWVSHLVLAPPLVISRPELDRGIDALDSALNVADARIG